MTRMKNTTNIQDYMPSWLWLLWAVVMLAGTHARVGAQEVTVYVSPVQTVLPPQAGLYVDNPGKFFTVRLINNTDQQQLVHLGMHIDQLFPEEQVMVVTPQNQLPRQPIALSPRQSKVLNPVEMKQLFTHFNLRDIYIRDGLYNDYERGIFGLLPEGQYRMYMQAFRWDPELVSPVQLNLPENGSCLFNICYSAQAPRFLTPQATLDINDPLSNLAVARLNKNVLQNFTWTQPVLSCNQNLVNFTYDVRVVKLNGLPPDEAIERNPVVYQRNKLVGTTLNIPEAYLVQMRQDSTAVYAMQVTANSGLGGQQNPLNYTLIENNGKSNVLLFRFYDPAAIQQVEPQPNDSAKVSGKVGNGKLDPYVNDSLYVFEQPTLTQPTFPAKVARKIFVGDSIFAEWRKAWFAGGRGNRQDTIKFDYTLQLFRGNSADEPKAIFKQKPVFEHTTKELKDTIAWEKIKDKIFVEDYLILRVIAKATNETNLRMKDDSLNYKDFALVEHFDENFACGVSTADVENKTLISTVPKEGSKLRIGSWYLELGGNVQQDKDTKALSGTGFIHWRPGKMRLRIAVKFDKLMVNTDNVVFEGVCNTYPKDNKGQQYTSQQAVDSLFSSWGLDNVWGDLGLPKDMAEKLQEKSEGKAKDIAEKYKLGEYYTMFKKAENQWDNWKEGNLLDLYLPMQLPDTIAALLPEDFSLQIASMMFTPKAGVMNVIGEFVLPKSDVLNDELLIFGAPRLCIQPDRILPEDGVLSLLSNFGIKDPSSGYSMTFKAPSEPMHPTDGCFLQWENDKFAGLGVQIAMTIPNLKRVVDGKAIDELPILDIKAVVEDNWGDWMGRVTMDPFEVEDLPGWTFNVGETIVFDHSYERNDPLMPDISKLPATYDPSKAGSQVKLDWKAWQGVYVKELSVQFPKWAVFGNGEEGFKMSAENMIFDPSGATLDIATYNLLEAKTGSAGGWEFDLDQAKVSITQNNFDSCHIAGRFAIPLFGNKTGKNGEEKQKVGFECDIRHLSEGTTTYYTYNKDGKREEHKKQTYGDKTRLAYIFKVQQIDSLNMDCFVADIDLTNTKEQTYLVVTAEDQPDGETVTHVELCMAGDITIAGTKKLEELGKQASLDIDMPGIHFAKMRLANFSRDHQNDKDNMVFKYANSLTTDRQQKEKEWEQDNAKRIVIFENKEIQLSENCFLDMGEWSLASAAKKLGPFSFNLKKFNFNYKDKILTLGIEGMAGLCDDMVSVGAGIDISTKLTIPKDVTKLSNYSLSDGDISFRALELDLDFSILHMNGRLEVSAPEDVDKGFKGALKFDIHELFAINCSGGYFDHKEVKDDKEERFAWGYFNVDIGGKAGIHIDPIVINRIMGGFFFNCRPTCSSAANTPPAERKYGDPVVAKGVIGISLGVGITTSAGEDVVQGDLDLNVVYDESVDNGHGGFSTIQFQGRVKAAGDIIDANICLTYENTPSDQYLSLDISVEGGLNGNKIQNAMSQFEDKLKTFKGDLAKEVKEFMPTTPGLDDLNSNYDNKADAQNMSADLDKNAVAVQQAKENEMKAMSVSIPFNMKFTWREKGVEQTPVRWHIYLGEPDEKKRVRITFIDYKSKTGIVSVKIEANAYLCIGNELPGNGQLPPIPPEISKFLNGSSKGGVDTGADGAKAQRSRNQAVKAMLPTGDNVKGGVMVGAMAYGYIDVNLGLFKANMTTIAGFDMALINYGNMAFCTNLNREMGHNGWYALGQFYAYLAARFDLHVKLGELIDQDVPLINAGIGGVFEAGLPNPTWVNGQARVKLALLGGLIDIDKKFEFACGDRCVPFKGNALDGFNLFSDFTIGSDSTAYGWYNSACEIRPVEISKGMFSSNASLGSQYRLVDPSTQADQANRTGQDEELLDLQSSRCYIFDLDRTVNTRNGHTYGVNGVRLFEIDPTKWDGNYSFGTYMHSQIEDRFNHLGSSFETSWEMKSASLSSARSYGEDYYDPMNVNYRNLESFVKNWMNRWEVDVRPRETKGTKYHLQNVTLKPNCYYVLMLTGTAYEVENGQKVWCTYVKRRANGKMVNTRIQWRQTKFFFFSTMGGLSVTDALTDLQPFVAAAFPASADGKLFNTLDDGDMVYAGDLSLPTIALKEDISTQAYKNGKLQWKLVSQLKGGEKKWKTEVSNNRYVKVGNMINMQPSKRFDVYNCPSNLQLTYTYKVPRPCYRGTIAEKWEAMELYIKQNDNWTKFKETVRNVYCDILIKDLDNITPGLEQHHAVFYAELYLKDDPQRQSDWNEYFQEYRQQNFDCQKDTTIVLADLWYNGIVLKSWYDITNNKKQYHETLPYSTPFIGIKPAATPSYSYDGKYMATSNFTQREVCLDEDGSKGNTKYRLQDPYMYFAYLSNYVFISGLNILPYAFDDVAVPFASESLTLTYNGESVEGKGLLNGVREQMATLQGRMYDTWNRWNYGTYQKGNDSYEPLWPLPDGSGEMYERTMANHNGKTPVYRPYTGVGYTHLYATKEFVQDFVAPYYIAEALSNKMKQIASTLKSWTVFPDADFEKRVRDWNNLHRGQYLTVSSRGFEVRVPYYQFPLIFGDCFAKKDRYGTNQPYDQVKRRNANESRRSFNSSLSTPSYLSDRWSGAMSNVLFMRMCGGWPFVTSTAHSYENKSTGIYVNGKKWYGSYINAELFSATEALKNVKSLPMKIYRTQGFDISNGKYYVNESVGPSGDNYYYYQAFYLPITKDPLHDPGSEARIEQKKSMADWIRLVGAPEVKVNDSRMKNE